MPASVVRQLKLPGEARARVSLAKWGGADVRTKGQKKYVAAKGLRTASEFKYRVKPLLAHFGSRPITKIRTSDIEDLQAELRRPRLIQGALRQPSNASVNRPVSDLRRILNWAVSREYLAATPFRRGGVAVVKLDKEDLGRNRRIASEEEERLIQAAPPHLRALIIIALATGVRAGEMLAIRIKEADLERNQITLRGTTTKSAKTRVVPIPTLRLRTVVEWLRFDAIGKPKPVTAADQQWSRRSDGQLSDRLGDCRAQGARCCADEGEAAATCRNREPAPRGTRGSSED